MDFGDEIRRLRELRGYSQRELARLAKLDSTYVSRLERGIYGPPKVRTIHRLARALDLRTHDEVALIKASGHLPYELGIVPREGEIPWGSPSPPSLVTENWTVSKHAHVFPPWALVRDLSGSYHELADTLKYPPGAGPRGQFIVAQNTHSLWAIAGSREPGEAVPSAAVPSAPDHTSNNRFRSADTKTRLARAAESLAKAIHDKEGWGGEVLFSAGTPGSVRPVVQRESDDVSRPEPGEGR